MKQNIEMCCSVFKTFDYGLFKNIKGNRELNPKNYKKILHSMGNKQLEIPIIVNEKYEIIDGQHRRAADRSGRDQGSEGGA